MSSRHRLRRAVATNPLYFAIAIAWVIAVAAPRLAVAESAAPVIHPDGVEWERQPDGTYDPVVTDDPGVDAVAPKIQPAVDAITSLDLLGDPVQRSIHLHERGSTWIRVQSSLRRSSEIGEH